MAGQVVVKGFSGYQVNEAMLANVVEAIKKGEADARRYSELRSFEVFYEGFRERLVLGRIMIVPAKLADKPEEFPSALLYGALVKEMTPDQQADLYSYKLGESEFDEYDGKDMSAIKDKLFKDADGVLRSIVMFLPTWANVRDYVVFKMTRDWDLLTDMVRHLVFAAYYDPRFSSAFNYLANDTETLSVSEINPKINYPGLIHGQEQSFPELVPGDGGVKMASAAKPRIFLAADTVDKITEHFLDKDEQAVIDNLGDELSKRVGGDVEAPEAVAEEGKKQYPDLEGESKQASTDDKGADTGLRNHGDYGESDTHTAEANRAAEAEPKTAAPVVDEGDADEEPVALSAEVYIEWGGQYDKRHVELLRDDGDLFWEDFDASNALDLADRLVSAPTVEESKQRLKEEVFRIGEPSSYIVFSDGETARKRDHATPRSAKAAVSIEGATLIQKGAAFVAKSANGYTETLRINGKKIKWARPVQFTNAFKQAAETYVRNPTHAKKADVPQTFDDIWSDIAEPMGPAPAIELKGVPKTDGSDNTGSPKSEAPAEKSEPSESKPEGKGRMDKLRETKDPEGKKTGYPWDDKSSKEAKVASGNVLGDCALCGHPVVASMGSEVAPEKYQHSACQEKAKQAAFNMFIPGQVLNEFYPELNREIIDTPTEAFGGGDGYDPAVGLPGNSPTGVPQSADGIPGNGDAYIPTGPSAAMGLGNDGKPQVLEGAPLRQKNDIRGYSFDQEYYATQQNLSPKAFVAAYAVERINKKASVEEFQAQFADFLKKAMGEIAASLITAFKVTSRPLMNKVPGTGEVKLDEVEQNNMPLPLGSTNIASRVRYLMGKLTDSQIQEAINGAWAQAAVWNEDKNGGYNYEVFIRPDSLDKTTMVLKYEFVVGTKGL